MRTKALFGALAAMFGSHSNRKGAVTYLCNAIVSGVSIISIFMRAGRSISKQHNPYFHQRDGGNHYCERSVAGLNSSKRGLHWLPLADHTSPTASISNGRRATQSARTPLQPPWPANNGASTSNPFNYVIDPFFALGMLVICKPCYIHFLFSESGDITHMYGEWLRSSLAQKNNENKSSIWGSGSHVW